MSNAIKNSILIILIILIGHFMLKNALLEENYEDNTCYVSLNNDDNISSKNIKANCDLIQDKKNMFIINEYHNENEMNDGRLTETLNAFDKYDFISV